MPEFRPPATRCIGTRRIERRVSRRDLVSGLRSLVRSAVMSVLRAATALLGCWLATVAVAAPGKPEVAYRDGRLTVHVRDVPLADVLRDVARLTGAEVRNRVSTDRRLTADLESLPVRDALERLLGEHNFALTYAEDGRLRL